MRMLKIRVFSIKRAFARKYSILQRYFVNFFGTSTIMLKQKPKQPFYFGWDDVSAAVSSCFALWASSPSKPASRHQSLQDSTKTKAKTRFVPNRKTFLKKQSKLIMLIRCFVTSRGFSAKRSFAFSEHRMHLGTVQASLTLLSVFTVFADVMDEFQNETGLCFWAAWELALRCETRSAGRKAKGLIHHNRGYFCFCFFNKIDEEPFLFQQ